MNILIGISGVFPSYFITGFNIAYFGLGLGLFLSFTGESIGAIIAFILYRKGLKKHLFKRIEKYPKIISLLNSNNKDAFYLIIYLRMLPFMPSGLVTLGGALGKVSLMTFAIASSLGKIPAMLIEGLTVYQVLEFNLTGKILLFGIGLFGAYRIIKRKTDEIRE